MLIGIGVGVIRIRIAIGIGIGIGVGTGVGTRVGIGIGIVVRPTTLEDGRGQQGTAEMTGKTTGIDKVNAETTGAESKEVFDTDSKLKW